MLPASTVRHPGVDYHLTEAKAWLALADSGKASTPLAYAGFELRLSIERILLQYVYSTDPSGFSEEALHLTGKKLEKRIYKLAGHQKQIDARLRLTEILFEMLGPFVGCGLVMRKSNWSGAQAAAFPAPCSH